MKIRILIAGLCFFLFGGTLHAQDSLQLTKKQERFLSKNKIKTNMMGVSTFNSYASFLYATDVATIHTDNPLVGSSKLQSFPDPNRKVSLRELFDEIARQTSSKWSYEKEFGYWLFSRPLPYELEIAQGWEQEVREGYIFYKPPTAPVGMDIYFTGQVDSKESPKEARNRTAEQFAKAFVPEIVADSMIEVVLPNHNALFFETKIQKKDIIWRQWAIVEQGICFVIVSAIKLSDEASILPDVEKMVNSFKVKDN